MRQIFRTLPWIHPAEPGVLQDLYRRHGVKRHVKKGEILKSGGEAPVLFFLEKGLASYWVNWSSITLICRIKAVSWLSPRAICWMRN